MSTKRIAVCISGQLRTWRKTINSWLPLIKNRNHVDVFVHTWNFNTVSTKINHDGSKIEKITENELEEFSRCINPCAILIESEKTFSPKSPSQAMQHPSHLSQFYGIMMASRLKMEREITKKITYDIVIRSRPDLYFSDDVAKMVNDAKDGFFNGFDLRWDGFNGKISDMFWISNSYIHDIIADSFLNLQEIEKKEFSIDPCEPENVLFFNLKRNSIPIINHDWFISIMRNSQEDASNLNGPRKDVW